MSLFCLMGQKDCDFLFLSMPEKITHFLKMHFFETPCIYPHGYWQLVQGLTSCPVLGTPEVNDPVSLHGLSAEPKDE